MQSHEGHGKMHPRQLCGRIRHGLTSKPLSTVKGRPKFTSPDTNLGLAVGHSLFDSVDFEVAQQIESLLPAGAASVSQNCLSGRRALILVPASCACCFSSVLTRAAAPFSRLLSGRMRFHLTRRGYKRQFWAARPSASKLAAPFWLATRFLCLSIHT